MTLHPGFERFAKEVDAAVPGCYQKVYDLLMLCDRVCNSMNELGVHPASKPKMLLKHTDFVKTAGYSAQEVIDTFALPQQAVEDAVDAIEKADLLIIGGTSLTVYPAASFVRYFHGKHTVVINKDHLPYPLDPVKDLEINAPIGKVLSHLTVRQ